jgi:hypothetical protein
MLIAVQVAMIVTISDPSSFDIEAAEDDELAEGSEIGLDPV